MVFELGSNGASAGDLMDLHVRTMTERTGAGANSLQALGETRRMVFMLMGLLVSFYRDGARNA